MFFSNCSPQLKLQFKSYKATISLLGECDTFGGFSSCILCMPKSFGLHLSFVSKLTTDKWVLPERFT